MRRILQRQGAEVVHLGHNRSVDEVVAAAIQEDAQGIAISSYQGGHVEYFSYLVELLRERGAGHIRVYGGGGGVIVPREIELLHERGVARDLLPRGRPAPRPTRDDQPDDPGVRRRPRRAAPGVVRRPLRGRHGHAGPHPHARRGRAAARRPRPAPRADTVPVLGITGTGGSGKSSLTDELVRRFRLDQEDKLRIAVLAVDPTRRKGGGALLGDRIRMNSITGENVFFRSMATRGAERRPPGAARRRHRGAQGGRVRPRDRRDARHRPGRRRDRAVRRPLAVRDDARVRCRVPAREDRHARLRRRRRDQQVRAARRRGRPPRRRPPARAQPRGVRRDVGGHAGVRHVRRDVQRRGRHRALPAPARAPAR